MKNIYVETIWTTKDCAPLISHEIEDHVYNLLHGTFIEMGCEVKAINGMPDHVHCLFKMNSQRSLSEIIKMVKGDSSSIINQRRLTEKTFVWEKSYEAVTIGSSDLEEAAEEIARQKILHSDPVFTVKHEIERLHTSFLV